MEVTHKSITLGLFSFQTLKSAFRDLPTNQVILGPIGKADKINLLDIPFWGSLFFDLKTIFR